MFTYETKDKQFCIKDHKFSNKNLKRNEANKWFPKHLEYSLKEIFVKSKRNIFIACIMLSPEEIIAKS